MLRFTPFLIASALALSAQTIPSLLNSAGQQATVPADRVVATVDGKNVTAGEVREALTTMPPEFTQLFNQNPQYAVQQLFMMQYLASEGERQKLGEQSPLKEQLAAMRANALASAMLTYEQNTYTPPPDQVSAFYDKNKANYKQAKSKVIAVAYKPAVATGTAQSEAAAKSALQAAASKIQRTEEEARARAAEVVQKARAGEDFESLVATYSDDEDTRKNKGSMSVKFDTVADVKKTVLAMNNGEITDPIKQPSAFLIFKVEEISIQPFQEVELPIIQELRSVHIREWFDAVTRRFQPVVKAPEFFGAGAMPPRP